MTTCTYCNQDMTQAPSCIPVPVERSGTEIPPIRYGQETRGEWGAASGARCHDCGAEPNGYHHPGCDAEECPTCHGQIISCRCNYTDAEWNEITADA